MKNKQQEIEIEISLTIERIVDSVSFIGVSAFMVGLLVKVL